MNEGEQQGEFGPMLRALRKQSGRTLSDVADKLGVSIPYVSDVETGKRRPFAMERLVILADALEADLLLLIAAAAVDKGVFELRADKSLSQRGLRVGSILVQRWHLLTDAQYNEVELILSNPGYQ